MAQKKSWYEISNEAGKPVQVVIEDEIGGWGVTAKQFRSDFARIGKNEAVSVHIKSGGGSIFEGNEIANIIGGHEGEVTVTLGSVCASIATVIMCAGDRVIAAKNSLVMIHNPEVYAGGDSEELRKMADIMDKMKAGIVKAYAEKTGKTEKEMSEMMSAETWMNAEEALANGFIDEISGEEATDDVADNIDLKHYKNAGPILTRIDFSGAKNKLTIANLRNSLVKNQNLPQSPPVQKTEPKNMTPEEIAAQKIEVEKQAKALAAELVKAQNARVKEIRGIVAQVLKRDKKDFSALADEFMATDKIGAENATDVFMREMLASEKFTVPKNGIGGSGIELVEPMDELKGTPGFQFVNSEQGRAMLDAWNSKGRHSFSLTLAVGGGFRNATQTSASPSQLTSIEYKPEISALGVRPLLIKSIIPSGATNATTIRGRRENAFTDDAAAVLETGALANVAVSVEEVDYPVKDLGGYIEMSENLLADYAAVASFINQRLPYKVKRVTDYQLLNGDGIGANLTGILSTAGIQTQAKGGDSRFDAIHKAKTKVETVPNGVQADAGGGYSPDYVIINPTDWETLKLTKDGNEQYYGGGPFMGMYGVGGFPNVGMLWGLPAVRSTAIAAGTALVGAFAECAQWFQRQGIVIEMTNANGTNFINRIVTVRAAERLALSVDLPNGFCQVTGL